jgi:hypothetical protein
LNIIKCQKYVDFKSQKYIIASKINIKERQMQARGCVTPDNQPTRPHASAQGPIYRAARIAEGEEQKPLIRLINPALNVAAVFHRRPIAVRPVAAHPVAAHPVAAHAVAAHPVGP